MTEQEERIKAADADQLLKNPMLREALESIEANIVNRLASSDLTPEQILRVQAILAGKRAFERYLTHFVTTGKLVPIEQEKKSLFGIRR